MTWVRRCQGWNTPEVARAIREAWQEDHPILLVNPALAALAPVERWLAELEGERAGGLKEGLEPGFHALLLTSGTTGEPRLVALDRASVLWNTSTLAAHLGLSELEGGGLHARVQVPLFHAFGLVLTWALTLRLGGRTTLVPRFDAAELVRWLALRGARTEAEHLLLPFVPAMVRSLPEPDSLPAGTRQRLEGVQGTSIVGGDRVTRRDLERLRALLPGVRHTVGYGLTEAGPALTHSVVGEPPEVDGGIGRPLPGVELRAGATGEDGWVFRSPGQAVALRERGDAGWRRTRGAWLPTGDLLEAAGPEEGGPERELRFAGRASWCFKKQGETVSPVLVEEALDAAYRAATGIPLERTILLGLSAAGTLVLKVEGARSEVLEAAIRSASLALPSFLRPQEIFWVPRLPRNALGKVERP